MKHKPSITVLAIVATALIILGTPSIAHDQTIVVAPMEEKIPEPVDPRPAQIDQYFESKGMPLAGYGSYFVMKADEYGIDWNLLPAISVIESTGGKHMCTNNPFGWGSCRIEFATMEEAIDTVSRNLGGHNPRTRGAYAGGSADDLWSYNGTVDPSYPGRVMAVMQSIAAQKVEPYQSK